MNIATRTVVTIAGAFAGMGLLAGPALADECMNASKPVDTGVQVVLDPNGNVIWVTPGLAARVQQGLVDPATGAGFHGLMGFDMDGDGVADISTYFGVGPDGEHLPEQAQFRGPACRGLTNIGTYFKECVNV